MARINCKSSSDLLLDGVFLDFITYCNSMGYKKTAGIKVCKAFSELNEQTNGIVYFSGEVNIFDFSNIYKSKD